MLKDRVRRVFREFFREQRTLLPIVAFVLVLPLLIFVVWFHGHQEHAPLFDFALTEMRVRDVGSKHTPLNGLPGRLGTPQVPGKHPGPLSFYLLAPAYRLLGSSWWALRASTALFNAAAIVISLMLARRAGGRAAILTVGVLLALLEVGFGFFVLTLPWNPYLPVFWFVVVLTAAWCVASGHTKTLPVMAVAASICAQTHISYLPIGVVLSVLACAIVAVTAVRSEPGSELRRNCIVSLLTTVALTLLLWAPPLYQELSGRPGNLSILISYFRHPPEPFVGPVEAARIVLTHLDVWHLTAHVIVSPSILRTMWNALSERVEIGAAVLIVWLACVFVSWRMKAYDLIRVHAVLAASLVIGITAVSRIIGEPWNYVILWGWTLGEAFLMAIAWTFGVAIGRRYPDLGRRRRVFEALGLSTIAVLALRLSTQVTGAASEEPSATAQLEALVQETTSSIRKEVGVSTGTKGRYIVTWDDAYYAGAQGIGLLNELERAGFRVGADPAYVVAVQGHRVIPLKDATARIHIATGAYQIRSARRVRGGTEVAFSDVRTPAEKREFKQLKKDAIIELRKEKHDDAKAIVGRFAGTSHIPNVSPAVAFMMGRMSQIGGPAAVFILPAGKSASKESL